MIFKELTLLQPPANQPYASDDGPLRDDFCTAPPRP